MRQSAFEYEVEIKSLLKNKKYKDKVEKILKTCYPAFKFVSKTEQLNHYFIKGDLQKIVNPLTPYLSKRIINELNTVVDKVKNYSLRTRWENGAVYFVLKASIDNTTSTNGISRIEIEEKLNNLSIEELDNLLLKLGFKYQSKWSRIREKYSLDDFSICIDKNAGYGYLLEVEKMVKDQNEVIEVKKQLREILKKLKLKELSQDRLERMFEYYNKHWKDYYKTDKTFIVL